MRKILLAFVVSAGIAATGCGGVTGSVNTVDGVFVGTTADSTKDVVIIADAPVGGSQRSFHAYVTDGSTVSELFSAQITGNLFDVTNSDGEISGTIDSFGPQGSVTINSASTSYDAATATGLSGLYSVTVDMAAGTVTGFSTADADIAGTIGTTAIGNDFQVTGTITPSGGFPTPFTALITQDSDGQQRWIVMPDSSILGGFVPNSGTGFVVSTS